MKKKRRKHHHLKQQPACFFVQVWRAIIKWWQERA